MITKEDAVAVASHLNFLLAFRKKELEGFENLTDEVVKRTMMQVGQSEVRELERLIETVCKEHKILHYEGV